jgi:hypothetical protein
MSSADRHRTHLASMDSQCVERTILIYDIPPTLIWEVPGFRLGDPAPLAPGSS